MTPFKLAAYFGRILSLRPRDFVYGSNSATRARKAFDRPESSTGQPGCSVWLGNRGPHLTREFKYTSSNVYPSVLTALATLGSFNCKPCAFFHSSGMPSRAVSTGGSPEA